MTRWPIGSCPECYDAGTPERPFCGQHGHDLTTSGVTLCDPHRHVSRDPAAAAPLAAEDREPTPDSYRGESTAPDIEATVDRIVAEHGGAMTRLAAEDREPIVEDAIVALAAARLWLVGDYATRDRDEFNAEGWMHLVDRVGPALSGKPGWLHSARTYRLRGEQLAAHRSALKAETPEPGALDVDVLTRALGIAFETLQTTGPTPTRLLLNAVAARVLATLHSTTPPEPEDGGT